MKKILLLFTIINYFAFAQMPETADSIYWSIKYCNTSETLEDCYEAYTWNGNIGDCYMAGTYGTGFCDALWPNVWLMDSYDCCCKVASLPGSEAAWNGFYGSPCQTYLDSIGFVYDDPKYVNWTSIEENNIKELDGIYIDMYGRSHITQPSGLSIMNRKIYFKVK